MTKDSNSQIKKADYSNLFLKHRSLYDILQERVLKANKICVN